MNISFQRWAPRGFLALVTAGAVILVSTALRSSPPVRSSFATVLKAGIAYQRSGSFDLAVTEYQRAHRMQPRNPVPLFDLGDVAQFRGQTDLAHTYYVACLALLPTYVNALYNLAILETAPHPQAAIALYTTATQQRATASTRTLIAESYFNRGYLFTKEGQKRRGAADIATAIALDPALRGH
jgi:tetratricopeptide (TPR) repeat protein